MRVRKSGFTLIELLVVCIIISIILGIVFPRLDLLLPKYSLRYASREIINIISLAKSEACYRFNPVYVVYDKEGKKLALLVPVDEKDEITNDSRIVYKKYMQKNLPEKITFESIELTTNTNPAYSTIDRYLMIKVTPYGEITPHRVVIANNEGKKIEIDVKKMTISTKPLN